MTAVVKSSIVSKLTPTFWTKPGKVVGLEDFNASLGMPRAAKAKSFTDGTCPLQHFLDLGPHKLIRVSIGVADEVHAILSTAE